jgi:transposase
MPKTPPYSEEFKREAVRLLRTSGRSQNQLAEELGVSKGSLAAWAKQLDVCPASRNPHVLARLNWGGRVV